MFGRNRNSSSFENQRKEYLKKIYEQEARAARLQKELDGVNARMMATAKKGLPIGHDAVRAVSLKRGIAEAHGTCAKINSLLDGLRRAEHAAGLGDLARSAALEAKKVARRMPREEKFQEDVDAIADAYADADMIVSIFGEPAADQDAADSARDDVVREIHMRVESEHEQEVLHALASPLAAAPRGHSLGPSERPERWTDNVET